MSDYNETVKKVSRVTDPNSDNALEIALKIVMEGDPVITTIAQLRAAVQTWIDGVEDEEHPHALVLKEETEAEMEKIEKSITLLIRAYVRGMERVESCNCNHCRAAAAPNN